MIFIFRMPPIFPSIYCVYNFSYSEKEYKKDPGVLVRTKPGRAALQNSRIQVELLILSNDFR